MGKVTVASPVKKENVLRFDRIEIGSYFVHNGILYIKTSDFFGRTVRGFSRTEFTTATSVKDVDVEISYKVL